jgi:hypothetical protein
VNVSIFSGPAQLKKDYPLVETGEYVATLLDLTYEAGGTYGDSLLWKWLLAPTATPTEYLARDDGNEKTFHEYTSPDVIVGSKSHEWIAALTGQVLAEGDEPPDAEDLIGKRMRVYLTHQAPKQGPNVGKLRERFVQGSAKPFTLVPSKTVARNAPARPEPAADEAERADLIARLEKLMGRAVKMETPNHKEFIALDLSEADTDQLRQLIATVQAEVQDALDA